MVQLNVGHLPANEKCVFYARLRKFEEDRQAFLRSFQAFIKNPLISPEDKWDETQATSSAVLQIAKLLGVAR